MSENMHIPYDYPLSGNCNKVRLNMAQREIPFQRVSVNPQKGETHESEFLKLNPNGKVPVLETEGGEVLTESNAILWYLARNPKYFGESPMTQAPLLQWMFFEQYSHEPYIATLRYWISYARKSLEFAREIEQYRPRGDAALDQLESRLLRNDFLVVDNYSIADICLYAYTHVAHEGGYYLQLYPALRRWIDRVAAQPGHIFIGD